MQQLRSDTAKKINIIKNTVKTLENQNQKELVLALQSKFNSNIHS